MKFQFVGPIGMSVNHTPRSSVAIGQMPFSSTTQMPGAGAPSGRRTVPMTRVLFGVMVAPGVGNGVVPGGGGPGVSVASGITSLDGNGVGSATPDPAVNGVGVGDGDASASAEGDTDGVAGWTAVTQPDSRAVMSRERPICLRIPLMFAHLPQSPVARLPST